MGKKEKKASKKRNKSKGRVEFVKYDGEYPNLCSGKLVLKVDGKLVEFPKYSLSSGGSASYKPEKITKGKWSIKEWPLDFPEELKKESIEIINDYIEFGCCGGCI